jgi:sulfoxide reductase heme-binding subunit YedZ
MRSTCRSDTPGTWRALHLVGGYYLLLQFTVSFGKRIPDMPLYALFLIPRSCSP